MKIGTFSRGDFTRGAHQARDHDREYKVKYVPCGIVEEESAELTITLGSCYKTSDFIVEVLEAKRDALEVAEKASMRLSQIKIDNGPESSGRRTQLLHRMVQRADAIHQPVWLRYYPPYHSTDHPIERCWRLLELQGNRTKLIDAETMFEWANEVTACIAQVRHFAQSGINILNKEIF